MTDPRRAATRSDAAVVAYLGFIGALLAFGIDTALPAFDEIRDEYTLADGSGEVSLVVTAYFLGMAAGQLPIGPLSDRFGRRPVLLSSLVSMSSGRSAQPWPRALVVCLWLASSGAWVRRGRRSSAMQSPVTCTRVTAWHGCCRSLWRSS